VLLWHAARRLGIRHLHAHFANVASDVALLTATLGSAVEPQRPWTWSFTMHGSADFWNVEANRLPQKTEQATFVACISDFARSQLMAHGPSAGWDRLHVVHCGVHPGDYDRAPAPAGPHGPLRLVTVGRLVPVKGQALLVDVAERLRARGIDAEVTIVGDGPERGALEAAIREHDLEERVRLTGAVGQDRVPGYLARSDVFVLPSFAEGVPVSAMEAMAAGLPVVASRVTGVPELIRDGVNGRLVTVARVEELVDAVAELARDPDLRRRLGEAARATVAEEFDVVREAARLRELFARYAAGP
jgi:glycosyltransferase involved in cell wall biosynthesis